MDPTPFTDPLLERLRAVDPAVGRDAPTVPAREQVARARQRRTARRTRRIGAGGALLACGVTLALALAPSGGIGDRGVLLRVVQAATPPAHSIVVIDTVARFGNFPSSTVREHARTWLLMNAHGQIAAYRWLVLQASRASYTGIDAIGNARRTRQFNPRTGHVRVFGGRSVPGTAFAVQLPRFLRSAAIGRPAHGRLERQGDEFVYTAALRVEQGWRELRELRFDRKTYAATGLRALDSKRIHGRLVSVGNIQRVLSRRTLPDTPANRRFLRLRGPRR
jgi:hypothetical protein